MCYFGPKSFVLNGSAVLKQAERIKGVITIKEKFAPGWKSKKSLQTEITLLLSLQEMDGVGKVTSRAKGTSYKTCCNCGIFFMGCP